MKIDKILEIGIDNLERLYIKPEFHKFTYIYRTASEVHWDNNGSFLYSPKPKEWTYLDWFKHIIKTAEDCNCKLIITKKTIWKNISEQLKLEISILK